MLFYGARDLSFCSTTSGGRTMTPRFDMFHLLRRIFQLGLIAMVASGICHAQILEEVIVTAEKREQNLQDVSLSVTALTGETMKEIGLGTTQEMGQYFVGMEVEANEGNAQPKFFIRGAGSIDFAANTQTTVGVYSDEVYIVNTFAHGMQVFDLNRVEVLRGPQGLLYGRNATAGAINFISNKPEQEFSGNIRVSYGNFEAVKVEGAVTGGITDTLAARGAFIYHNNDGWMTGRTTFPGTVGGDDLNSTDYYSWRGMLSWTPNDDVDVLLKVHGSQDRSDAYNFQHLGSFDATALANFDFANLRCNPVERDDCISPFGYIDPDGNEDRGDPTAGDFNRNDEFDLESLGISLRFDWALESFTITSITAWDKFARFMPSDADGSPFVLSHFDPRHETDGWSQEIRLTSTTDGPLEWILGFYYAEDDLDANQMNTTGVFYLDITVNQQYYQEQESIAAFANVGYQLNEQLKLNAGLRYTEDDIELYHASQEYIAEPFTGFLIVPTFPLDLGTDADDSYSELTWKVGIDYTPNDNWLIYGSVRTGYKSGGIGPGFGNPLEFSIFDKETILAYEVGFKSQLLDDKVNLNASAYYYDYEDKHEFDSTFLPLGGQLLFVSNAPEVESYGFEVELAVAPVEGLELLFGASYLESEFQKFTRVTGEDMSGNSPAYAPEWKFNGIARYEWAVPQLFNGTMAGTFSWSWTDDLFHDIRNTSDVAAKAHWLTNARLSYFSSNQKLEIALWAKNLNDAYYRLQTFNLSDLGWLNVVPNVPRTYGVEIGYNW